MTGCGKPCNYLEYKFQGGSIPSSFKLSDSSDYFVFSLLAQTRHTSVEREELLYQKSTMVAEVGGTLGLFLGFSFMTIWDGLKSLILYMMEVKKASDKINTYFLYKDICQSSDIYQYVIFYVNQKHICSFLSS